MNKIHALDATTIHKIAAGEVIDRPASVVKELLENSLDSGATRIHIDLRNGGKSFISITDNGNGISQIDLPLAPLPHTTSKLHSIDDLEHIVSFGFRGEALASICHIAELTLISKTAQDQAYQLHAHQNHISDPELTSHPQGTTVQVKELFFNIPVRQKFLKSDTTEASYCYDVVLQAALIHPQIDFVLTHQGKELLNATGLTTQSERIIRFFGRECAHKLCPIHLSIGGIHYKGVMSDPTLHFSNRAKQILSVNKRPIKSGLIQKAIQLGFKDLIPANRFPLIILDMALDTTLVDINIHPQKQEVKFLENGQLFEAIPKVIHQSLNPHMPLGTLQTGASLGIQPQGAIVHTASGYQPAYAYPASQPPHAEFSPASAATLFSPQTMREIQSETFEFLQVYDTYLIVKAQHGTWILDQHAVHERVLYEQFKTASRATHPPIQPLLISEVIELTPDLYEIYVQEKSRLDELGFETDEFGPQQFMIRGVPEVFTEVPLREWILSFLADFKEVSASPDKLLLQKEDLQMMACKAAIKAGKPMRLQETKALIQDFLLSPSHYTCPHGRPLFVPLGKIELEKLFLRR